MFYKVSRNGKWRIYDLDKLNWSDINRFQHIFRLCGNRKYIEYEYDNIVLITYFFDPDDLDYEYGY